MNNLRLSTRLWALVAASCLPILFFIPLPGSFALKATALHLSAIAGYVGVVLLLWMYILGAKSVMGLVFKDVAGVLAVHKKLGKYGSIAFLLHPLLVTYAYGESWLYSLVPHVSTAFERTVTLGRIGFMLLAMIWITSALLRSHMGYRPWKYLHYFAYISLPFALLHVPGIGTQYASADLVRVYFYAVTALFVLFTLVRLSSWLNLDRKSYVITGHKHLGEQDYLLVLRPTGASWLTPKNGQYIYIKHGIISEDHPFSVAYCDQSTGQLTIVYRVYGGFTRYLARLQKGQAVSLAGPYGAFTSDIKPRGAQPAVFVAAGVGITPFVQHILDNPGGVARVFAANRTHESAVMVKELRNTLRSRLVPIYSRDTTASDTEEYGHIGEDMFRKYLPEPQKYSYYLCGPQGFVAKARCILRTMDVPVQNIHEEIFAW